MDDNEGAGGPEPASGAPSRSRTLELAGHPGPVAEGRDFVRRALSDWYGLAESGPGGITGTTTTIAADVVLLASEVLTNACLHAGGPLHIVVSADDKSLRIEIDDPDPEPPRIRAPRQPGIPGGHGLHIVEKLTDRWGVVPSEHGKTVWMEIDADRLTVA